MSGTSQDDIPAESKFDEYLKRNPPKITWRRKPGGIWIHTSIDEGEGRGKLTPDQVREIRRRYATGEFSHGMLAIAFSVKAAATARIVNHVCWNDVADSPEDTQLLSAARTEL
jgi:hypothetical protein